MKTLIKVLLTIIVWTVFLPTMAFVKGAEYVFDDYDQKGMMTACVIIGVMLNLVYAVFLIVLPFSVGLYGVFQCL